MAISDKDKEDVMNFEEYKRFRQALANLTPEELRSAMANFSADDTEAELPPVGKQPNPYKYNGGGGSNSGNYSYKDYMNRFQKPKDGFYRTPSGGENGMSPNGRFYRTPVAEPNVQRGPGGIPRIYRQAPVERPNAGRPNPNDFMNAKRTMPATTPGRDTTGRLPNDITSSRPDSSGRPTPGRNTVGTAPNDVMNAKRAARTGPMSTSPIDKAAAQPGNFLRKDRPFKFNNFDMERRMREIQRPSGGTGGSGGPTTVQGLLVSAGAYAMDKIIGAGVDEYNAGRDEDIRMQNDANTMGRELEFAAKDGYKPQFLQDQLNSPKQEALLNLGKVLAEYEFARREMDRQNSEADQRRASEKAADDWFAEQERYRREGNGPGPGYNMNTGEYMYNTPEEWSTEYSRRYGGQPAAVPVRGNR